MRAILIKLPFIFTHTIVVLIYDKISRDKITNNKNILTKKESSVTEKDNQPSVTFKVFFVLFFFTSGCLQPWENMQDWLKMTGSDLSQTCIMGLIGSPSVFIEELGQKDI